MKPFAFVTTCKGRLKELQQALPTWLELGYPVTVVDYSCPDGTAAWLREHHPEVTVVEIRDKDKFNLAFARNAGVNQTDAVWLCMIDCDVKATRGLRGFFRGMSATSLRGRNFFINKPPASCLSGTFLIKREDYVYVHGHDEVINYYGAGYDEIEMYWRLERVGAKRGYFPLSFFEHIDHEDRMKYYQVQHRKISDAINYLYFCIKVDVLRYRPGSVVELPSAYRENLMHQVYKLVRKSVLNSSVEIIEVDIGDSKTGGIKLAKSMQYTIDASSLIAQNNISPQEFEALVPE